MQASPLRTPTYLSDKLRKLEPEFQKFNLEDVDEEDGERGLRCLAEFQSPQPQILRASQTKKTEEKAGGNLFFS